MQDKDGNGGANVARYDSKHRHMSGVTEQPADAGRGGGCGKRLGGWCYIPGNEVGSGCN